MAEETVKRVTGLNPMVLGRSNVPSVGIQFVSNPMDVPPVPVAAPLQPNPNQFFHQTVPNMSSGTAPNHQRLDTGYATSPQVAATVGNPSNDNITQACNLQHSIRSVSPSGVMPGWDSGLPHSGAKNNK